MLGVAVDVDFETNGFIYVLYTHNAQPGPGSKTARLSRIRSTRTTR